MPSVNIIRESPIIRTPRVMQLEGMFEVPPSERSAETWVVDLKLPEKWDVGLIAGPSGSGKTTIAKELFGVSQVWEWPRDKSIVDAFPATLGIKEIVELLSSVGFSSPPSWLRPYDALSNGEQFRVTIARTLAESPKLAVIDEFTSVVDRTVAQIASAAIQKTVRRRKQRFIAVSCHYDIVEWLEPDWIYEPHTNEFRCGRLWRRPEIKLEIKRVHHSAWRLFRKHHYLDTGLNKAGICFVAFWKDVPVCFSSWLPFMGRAVKRGKREHRTVTLPDYQGVGIGNRVSNYLAAMWHSDGYRVFSTTSHPSMATSRLRSGLWRLNRDSGFTRPDKRAGFHRATTRLTYGFEFVGAKTNSTSVSVSGKAA